MFSNVKKPFVIIGILLLLTVIVLFLSFAQQNNQLEYSPNDSNNIAGPLVIKAKEPIHADSGSYAISPEVAGNLQVVDNYIIFWPEQDGGFVLDTAYRATFKDYRTVSNEPLDQVDMEFTISKDTDYSELQKEVLEKYGVFEASFNPFLEKLPHQEDYRFKISYAINEPLEHNHEESEEHNEASIVELLGDKDNWREKKDNYIVYIETLVFQSRNQDDASYLQDVQQARKDALKWIADQGVDVNKDINYEFIPDDATLQNPGSGREEIPTILGDDY